MSKIFTEGGDKRGMKVRNENMNIQEIDGGLDHEMTPWGHKQIRSVRNINQEA